MRYYFVDQDRNDTVIDLNRVTKTNGVVSFHFKDRTLHTRKLAGKLFASWDKVSWFKLTQIPAGESVSSNATTYKVYRGFKPSGLFVGGAGSLITQMPGKVVKLLVNEGDRVEKGQTVLILEAMKMENEIKAGVGGVIKNLAIKVGQALDSGVLMAEIEEG